jgi:hypothetical protein
VGPAAQCKSQTQTHDAAHGGVVKTFNVVSLYWTYRRALFSLFSFSSDLLNKLLFVRDPGFCVSTPFMLICAGPS